MRDQNDTVITFDFAKFCFLERNSVSIHGFFSFLQKEVCVANTFKKGRIFYLYLKHAKYSKYPINIISIGDVAYAI